MSLLAKSCLCPGLIAVISNLITSSGDPPDVNELPFSWLHQYWQGQGFEIYKTQLPNFFRGKTFMQAVLVIYKKFEAVLFGLELVSDDNERIFLNPGEMMLPLSHDIRIMGYIISQDKGVADDIASYKSKVNSEEPYRLQHQFSLSNNIPSGYMTSRRNSGSKGQLAQKVTLLNKI